MVNNLQKVGGISALTAAATFLFAFALLGTVLGPMADQNLGFEQYISFLKTHQTLIYLWHFVIYIVNGISLIILVLALYEKVKPASPRLALVASALGMIWAVFVLLSGFIVNFGNEALLKLALKDMQPAENLKTALETVTLAIDSSDKVLGALWVGLISLGAFKFKALPRVLSIPGVLFLLIAAAGMVFPGQIAVSMVFGLGVLIWWIVLGIVMLSGRKDESQA